MVTPTLLAATVIGAGALATAGTGALVPLLRRAAVLDNPNARSSHTVPTPRGGGIAVVGALLCGWLVLLAAGATPPRLPVVMAGAVMLAAVSWIDDRGGLSPLIRLVMQLVAVAVGLAVVAPAGLVFQGWLPAGLDMLAAGLLWLWFVNLFNFMDGIDGIAGSEAAAIGVGLMLVASSSGGDFPGLTALAGCVAAVALGFLVWNWAPARIFLGDVGSVPLGYVIGFLLLYIATQGCWRLAIILPLYFVADATITLLRRLARGERVWQPHREHFYQRAVRRGFSHAEIVRRVIAADVVLIGAGWAAETGWGLAGLTVAAATVLALLADLAWEPPPHPV